MAPHPFRAAVEARDLQAMVAALAPDAVFHSPVVFRPYQGRDAVAAVLEAVFEVLEGFRYTDELAGPGVRGLVFRARVGDREVQGIDLLRDDEQGRVAELTVMLRPLSAVLAVRDAMARRLGVTA